MPVTVCSAKKKGPYTFTQLTAQKKSLVSPAHVQRYCMTINLTTEMKSILITKHDFIQVIIFFLQFVKYFNTKLKSFFFATIAQALRQL